MAHPHPQNGAGQQPAVDAELQIIMNSLVFGRRVALDEFRAMRRDLHDLRIGVRNHLVADNHSIFPNTVQLINNLLSAAMAACESARAAIFPHIVRGERFARRSLTQHLMGASAHVVDNLSDDELQEAIIAAQQRNIWRRVAHQRVNAVLPPADALLLNEAVEAAHPVLPYEAFDVAAAVTQSRMSFEQANAALVANLEVALGHLEGAAQLLDPVLDILNHARRHINWQVHNILTEVMRIHAVILDFWNGSFENSYNALTSIQGSLNQQVE